MAENKERLTYTVSEAAAILGVAANSLYASIADGYFTDVIRIGRRILIPRKALERRLSGELIAK